MIDFLKDCLYEASVDKEYIPYDSRDVINVLIQRFKFVQLGRGAYAAVLEHPDYPDVVAKIEYRIGNDYCTGNARYLKYAMKFQHQAWAPKIHFMEQNFKLQIKKHTEVMNLTIMEKLNPIIQSELNENYNYELHQKARAFQRGICHPEGFYAYCNNPERLLKGYTMFIHRLQRDRYPDCVNAIARADMKNKNQIALARKHLIRFFAHPSNVDCAYDLQMCNIMLRPGTNDIVVTDPAS